LPVKLKKLSIPEFGLLLIQVYAVWKRKKLVARRLKLWLTDFCLNADLARFLKRQSQIKLLAGD
jgi:hypothetical protein